MCVWAGDNYMGDPYVSLRTSYLDKCSTFARHKTIQLAQSQQFIPFNHHREIVFERVALFIIYGLSSSVDVHAILNSGRIYTSILFICGVFGVVGGWHTIMNEPPIMICALRFALSARQLPHSVCVYKYEYIEV